MIAVPVTRPAGAQSPPSPKASAFSFIPEGLPRSIAEYLASALVGAILLFAFYVASESTLIFTGEDMMAFTFLPVVCLMPVLAGAVASLVLERIRQKEITLRKGALVGAASGLISAAFSTVLFLLLFLVSSQASAKLKPFDGSIADPLIMLLALLASAAFDIALAAAGGALAAKFIREN